MPLTLWNDFFDRFTVGLSAVDPITFLAAWDLEEARTTVYRGILKGVADGMGLAFKREHCRIDFMLGSAHPVDRDAPGAFVPVIAVESENEAMDAHNEVNYLHALTAPVKVLITCALWTREGRAQWEPQRLLAHWRAIRQAHVAAVPQRPDDVFAVIVGEKAQNGRSVRFFLEMLSDPAGSTSGTAFATVSLPA
ncbi:hypothetical protein SAMN05216466_106140 [Paraburkholderia phenazinium]|uniref:Uncharacterized protein n=1 Tax=Paraburkholderia phenazinium TaxID=60549 RepID=A0A1G7YD21_9BURK|nr:hypothetical protein [Paraburkholderia phenazinium]SDG94452.1 hypothetical protein SAMN05216466_106140 [Paraburkholderia phenazinium]